MAPIRTKKLTIAIPTYNRNETLKYNLTHLLPQLTDDVSLVIYDNFSDVPVAETLDNELKNYSQITVIRSKANIGLSGNIIKCIELCDTSWVWLLSDDDTPQPSAVQTILNYITQYPDLYFINFKSNYTPERAQDVFVTGENEFIEQIDNIHNFFLISLGIYNVEKVRNWIRFAYLYAYSIVPHFVMLMISLKSTGQAMFSKELIISSQGIHKDANKMWSMLPLCLGLPTLVELPLNLSKKNQAKLFNFINHKIIGRPLTSFERVIQMYGKEDMKILKHNFSQPYLRQSSNLPLIWKLEYLMCIAILNVPFLIPLSIKLLNGVRKLAKKPVVPIASDRFNRI